MAASSLTAVRIALKGTHLVPGRCLLAQSSQTQAVRLSLRLHVCSRMESQWSSYRGRAQKKAEGPKFLPKSPMMKIGLAWLIGFPTGIVSFFLVKMQVDKNRVEQFKVRERMRRANEGEYEGSRYRHRRHHSEDVNPNR